MSDPTIRLSTCRPDGRCPECGYVEDGGYRFTGVAPCGCTVCVICEPVHLRALLTEALRQRDAIDEAQHHGCTLAEDHPTLRLLAAVRAERDAALRKGAAERAMLDEILALPDIEAPTGDGSENVAAVVASALEALREERDAAIRQVEEQRHPCPCGKDTASIKWARCYSCRQRDTEERDAAIREHQRALGEAAEIAQGLQSKLDEVTRERDEARTRVALCEEFSAGHPGMCCCQCIRQVTEAKERADRAEALLAEARTEHRDISKRYIAASSARIRAEALLRECLAVLVALPGNTSADSAPALIAKIWEAVK